MAGAAVAEGLERSDARRLEGGEERRHQGDDHADDDDDDDRAGADLEGPVGELGPAGGEELLEQSGNAEATEQSEDRGEHADEASFQHDHAADLLGARSDGPQEPVLTGSLSDQGREGVVDDEGADEQHHDGEAEQDVAEDVDEVAELGLLLSDHDLAGHGLEPVGEHGGDRRDELFGGDAVGGVHHDGVDETLGVEHPLGGREVEADEVGATGAALAEIEGADEGEEFRLAGREADGDLLADRESARVRLGGIEHDLLADGWAAFDVPEGRHGARAVPRGGEHRRAEGSHDLTGGVDGVGLLEGEDAALGHLHLGERLDGGDDAVRELQEVALGGVEVALGHAHLGVDSGEGVFGHLVEDRAQAVGEHERPGDEGDAEDDRDQGEDEAPEVRADATDDESEHGALSRRAT